MRKPPVVRLAMAIATFLGCTVMLSPVPLTAQDGGDSRLSFARETAVRALNFQQGDAQALGRVRPSFSDDGWQQFLTTLNGWLDSSGAPTFSSSFVPSATGRIVDETDGLVHVRIPGSLTQTQNQSRTVYRVAAVDVWVAGSPPTIHRLTQTTCVGSPKPCQ